jgi:hypothetical protein
MDLDDIETSCLTEIQEPFTQGIHEPLLFDCIGETNEPLLIED